MDIESFYALWREEMISEGIEQAEFDDLENNERIAWGKFFRSLKRHGVMK